MQSRTHTCNELRIENKGEQVTITGWYDNLRKVSKNLGFLILRDFYGVTQVVIETEEMMDVIDGVNNESTLSVTGVVRERSSKNSNIPTGDIKLNIALSDVDSNAIAENIFGAKNQLYGTGHGRLIIETRGDTTEERIKNLNGECYFVIIDGKMPKLG